MPESIPTFYASRRKESLLYVAGLFPWLCLISLGIGLITTQFKIANWLGFLGAIVGCSFLMSCYPLIYSLPLEGFTGVQVTGSGLNILQKGRGRIQTHVILWEAIRGVTIKPAYPGFLKMHRIELLGAKEGMTNHEALPRSFPSGWVILPLPWPLSQPVAFRETLLAHAPADNPLAEFFCANPTLSQ
jgi:hypothetical protein